MSFISHHNKVVRAGRKRAEKLEPKLVRVLEQILNQAAEKAARGFTKHAHDHLAAAGLGLQASAPGVTATSTMVALYPRPEEAAALAHAGGEEADLLHCTLAFLGPTEGPLSELVDALRVVSQQHAPLAGEVGGIGAFADNGDGAPLIAIPDVPGMVELRQAVASAISATNGVEYMTNHGFVNHVTVAYSENGGMPDPGVNGQPLHFDALCIVRGDEMLAELPLCGPSVILAAGTPPDWTPPIANEVIDVDALVSQFRGKTDPVRRALIETVMGAALKPHGIDWDATNPLTAKVLAQTGSQITEIAATTQLNVMRIIRRSYEEGLTIPDTAKAIRSGMKEASTARALLIARTEMVGAVNGGSLAATQIVSDASTTAGEGRMLKEWLTAEGATYPRHEEYDDLDGQTQELDAPFDVGGWDLMFPGDPDGPPEEVCNCRCALAYVDAEEGA